MDSESKTARLLQLQAVLHTEDTALCSSLLEACNWNMDLAVSMALAEDASHVPAPAASPAASAESNILRRRQVTTASSPPSPSPVPSPSRPVAAAAGATSAAAPEAVAAASPSLAASRKPFSSSSSPSSWLGWLSSIVSFPMRFLQFLLLFIRTLLPVNQIAGARRLTLKETLAAKYPGKVFPAFVSSTFQEACNEARRRFKFLFVYVHSEDHVDTDRFCREVLSDPALVSFLDESFVCFGAAVSTPEGQAVAQHLRVATFPFVALLVAQEHSAKMMLALRQEGRDLFAGTEALLEVQSEAMERYGAVLVAQQADVVARSHTQTLREEQDQAYQQSLREDQEKEARKQAEIAAAKAEAEAAERKAREEKEQEERAKEERERKKERIPQEPPENAPCAKISVTMPGGKRLIRRFPLSSTVQDLYDYVECEGTLRNFSLFTSYPKKELTEKHVSLDEAGLTKAAILCLDNDA